MFTRQHGWVFDLKMKAVAAAADYSLPIRKKPRDEELSSVPIIFLGEATEEASPVDSQNAGKRPLSDKHKRNASRKRVRKHRVKKSPRHSR